MLITHSHGQNHARENSGMCVDVFSRSFCVSMQVEKHCSAHGPRSATFTTRTKPNTNTRAIVAASKRRGQTFFLKSTKKHDRCKTVWEQIGSQHTVDFLELPRQRLSTSGHRKLRDMRPAFCRLLVRKTCGGWSDAPAHGANSRRL